MDVEDILSFTPPFTPKRPITTEEDSHSDNYVAPLKVSKTLKKDQNIKKPVLLKPDTPQISQSLDEPSIKQLISLFEKRIIKNRDMRIKFPDNASKFMLSEVELHDMLQEVRSVAVMPALVGPNTIHNLIELLTHPNTDIVIVVLDILQELTAEDVDESEDHCMFLIETLLNNQICSVLVECMYRLNEESEGIYNALAIFENIINFKSINPNDTEELIIWILKKIKKPSFDNKLHSSEILSILLQNSTENREFLGSIDGLDVLLQQISYYKRYDPLTTEEIEFMENIFNCVCSCLLHPPNKLRFLLGEGVQLMNLILREKKKSRSGALKVLNYALSGVDGKENCKKCVDILGLRTIFPLFMKTPKKNRKKFITVEQHEEHVLSIICSLLKNCDGPQLQRILMKFNENDNEKVDRLLELHFKYLEKVEDIDDQLEEIQRVDHTVMDESEVYMKRLDNGLFTLQLIDYIILQIYSKGPTTIKQRIVKIVNLRGASLEIIKHIMRDYVKNLGDGNLDTKQAEGITILKLINEFGMC